MSVWISTNMDARIYALKATQGGPSPERFRCTLTEK